MRAYRTTGIIIKRKNIGEADRILCVFTKDQGKIHIKAKGVRKITSKRSSHVELLNHEILHLYKGKSMPVLTEIETIESFRYIKTNLQKTGFAYYICELIEGLCPENQENMQVYSLLVNTLRKLEKSENVISIIHEFEISLLSFLGYWANHKKITFQETANFIENILERKLKTRQIIPYLNNFS